MDKMYKKAAEILEEVAGHLKFIVQNDVGEGTDITDWKSMTLDNDILALVKARAFWSIAESKEKEGN